LEYQFNVTSIGGIQPFSFSFTSATFLQDGNAIAFPQFTVTDGPNSWDLTQGLAREGGVGGCFEFGTTLDSSLDMCSVSATPGSSGGAMLLSIASGLPMATGVYDLGFSFFNGDPAGLIVLDGTLDITSLSKVPEPGSIGLLGIVLAIVGWTLRKRAARELCDSRERC
jgi:hypothetical protein